MSLYGRAPCVVVIPAYNEAATIGDVVSRSLALGLPVVVVSDASTDATATVASSAGAVVLELPCRIGAWGAAQTGMRHALRRGAQIIVTLDGDGQHAPESMALLLEADPIVDIVIGACPERGSAARLVAWRFFRGLSGLEVRDLTSGFRRYSRRAALMSLGMDARLLDFQDIGVLLLARRKGCVLREVRVPMVSRPVGKSHVFYSWLRVVWYMAYTSIVASANR